MKRTFAEQWKVNFGYFAVEAEDGLQMSLDDVSCQVGDDDDSRVRLLNLGINVHFDIRIVQGMG